MNNRVGGCQCGAVRYEVEGDSLRVGLCHCTDCRKTSGSAFTLFAIWPRSAFSCTGHIATYKGDRFARPADRGSSRFELMRRR